MRRSDKPCHDFRPSRRTTQIIYGERQHLRAVLVSIRNFRDYLGMERETELLHKLIDARTAELEQINLRFDEQLQVARDPETRPEQLASLAAGASQDDWLLLRTIVENPNTPSQALATLVDHPYEAVREHIARHPRADAATLEKLSSDPERELWLLVACNTAAPPELRERLRTRFGDEGPKDSAITQHPPLSTQPGR